MRFFVFLQSGVSTFVATTLLFANGLHASEQATDDLAQSSSIVGKLPDIINTTVPEWALQSYGDDMLFTVKREGKAIGTHSVKFSSDGDAFLVDTETRLKVKFLFFTAYRFEYTAQEIWQNGEVRQVFADTNNNGKDLSYEMTFDGGQVAIKEGEANNVFQLEPNTYPSNHWHPRVLGADVIINTLSGIPNQVEITPRDWELVQTGQGERRAQRYEYSGELADVSSWYDETGRWVALEFKGDDGSTITYECVRCGAL